MDEREFLAELKIPAERDFITAAKRVGACLGADLGFTLEEIDDLNIAIAQACENTIDACEDIWGPESGATLNLQYGHTGRGISVEVEAAQPTAAARLVASERRHKQALARTRDVEMDRIAQEMIRFFVDDYRSRVDAGSGHVHFRMVKYRVG